MRVMKANRLIATVLIVCCALMLHAGCQEEAAAPQQLNPAWFRQFEMPAEQPPAEPMPPTIVQNVRQPEPRITFDKVVHDFGTVGLQTESLCEFKFTNTGDGVLTIGEITKACGGCTAFQLDKSQYAPGESGILRVKFYSDTQLGQTTKNLTIHSNDRTNPEAVLAVTAKVISKVDFEPKSLNLLLTQANAGCPKITLTSTDGQPFSISHFRSTADCITADYNPSAKAMQFVIEPKIDMARLAGNLNGRIEIGLTHPECKAVTVSVKTVPRFKFSPLLARGAKPNETLTKKVRLINNYNENFAIASVSSRHGAANAISAHAIGGGYEIEVEITPPAGDKMRLFTETLIVTTATGDKIEIPCNVFYAGAEPPTTAKKSEKCTTCGPRVIYRGGVNLRGY